MQLAQGALVQVEAIVLVVGAFVPLESQPGQVVNQLSGKFRALAAIVQVLDAQHDAAALAAGRKPRAQAAEHVAQVHAARGRRAKRPTTGAGTEAGCVVGASAAGVGMLRVLISMRTSIARGTVGKAFPWLASWRRCALRTVGLRPNVSIAVRRLGLIHDRNPGSSSQLPGFPAEKGDMILERTGKGQPFSLNCFMPLD